jgi:AraC-like DNA-binding protein
MLFEVTPDNFDHLFAEAELNGQTGWKDTETDEIDWANLSGVAHFYSCYTDLQDGLQIEIQRHQLKQNLYFSNGEEEIHSGAGLTFYLSGKVQTQLHGLTEEYEEPIGHYDLCGGGGFAETERWLAVQPFFRLYVHFDSVRLFSDWTVNQQSQLPVEIQNILEGNYRSFAHWSTISPEMTQVIQQILHCPHVGVLKLLYLQGKARELIALALQPFLPKVIALPSRLKPEEIERIHHAKNLFLAQLDRPPSLAELAQQVGLNQFSLGQKFKQVFNTTLFRYLHDYRLDVARQLLADRSLRIEEVAQRVGLTNRGYFAAAFRKKFGLSPKDYRRQQKNDSHF